MFHWFETKDALFAFSESIRPLRQTAEKYLSNLESFDGYCCVCERISRFTINAGTMFGDSPSLREGMVCEHCGLGNRNRLMFLAITSLLRAAPEIRSSQVVVLEKLSPLFRALKTRYAGIVGCEYLGDKCAFGQECLVGEAETVRNESVTELTFQDESVQLICHNDILEHIYDYRAALRECRRVLESGGHLIFTCPFFMQIDRVMKRADLLADGTVVHHEPPEFHSDALNPRGILAYYHFGWGLLQDMRDLGFRRVEIGVRYDVFSGLVSNNYPNEAYGYMLPVVFRAQK